MARMARVVVWMLALTAVGVVCDLCGAASWRDTPRPADSPLKVCYYTSALNGQTAAAKDSLARADLIVAADRPEEMAKLRQKNPNLRFAYKIMPQFAQQWDGRMVDVHGRPTWWLADTTWSPMRDMQFMAKKNNWYMPNTSGQPIVCWNHNVLNWTIYCPKGTYGAAKGLRASEYFAVMMARHAREWGWDSLDTFNAIMLEAMADCLGSYGKEFQQKLAYADPDRDGVAEGNSRLCGIGGASEELTVLIRQENARFRSLLRARLYRPDLPIIVNSSNDWMGPAWRTDLNGMKLENWFPGNIGHDGRPWLSWMYGDIGRGYVWTEKKMTRPGVLDSLLGWDMSLVTCYWDPKSSALQNARRARLALGTALLGDGYLCLTKYEMHAWQIPEFAIADSLGHAKKPYIASAFGDGDTLYIRSFERGKVWVNPGSHYLNGVPPQDAKVFFEPKGPERELRSGPDPRDF